MSFFLLYLFTQIESIAALFTMGGSVFLVASFAVLVSYIVSFVMSSGKDDLDYWTTKTKKYRKTSTIVALIGGAFFVLGSLLPNKKDLALIVIGGTTYEVLTSNEAKEIGGKALEILKKQMDDALKDDDLHTILKEQAKKEIKDAVSS